MSRTKNDYSRRMLAFADAIIELGRADNYKDYCQKMGVSENSLSEIKSGRQSAGPLVIQKSVLHYQLSANWLFTGKGDMFIGPQKEDPTAKAGAASKPTGVGRLEQMEADIKALKADNIKMQKVLKMLENAIEAVTQEPATKRLMNRLKSIEYEVEQERRT